MSSNNKINKVALRSVFFKKNNPYLNRNITSSHKKLISYKMSSFAGVATDRLIFDVIIIYKILRPTGIRRGVPL